VCVCVSMCAFLPDLNGGLTDERERRVVCVCVCV